MRRLTKKEFLSALADYPDESQIFFNDDEAFRVLALDYISFRDDNYVPDLCPEQPCPKIFIHLNHKMEDGKFIPGANTEPTDDELNRVMATARTIAAESAKRVKDDIERRFEKAFGQEA